MGLRDEITADIAEAFDSDLADAVSEFTGSRVVGQGPYDPVTETRPTITESYAGRGVIGSFDMRVVDGILILRTDIKITALQAEIVGDAVKIGDTIVRGGESFKVIQIEQDPAGASYSIQIRRV